VLLERWQNPKTARALGSVGVVCNKYSLGTKTFYWYKLNINKTYKNSQI